MANSGQMDSPKTRSEFNNRHIQEQFMVLNSIINNACSGTVAEFLDKTDVNPISFLRCVIQDEVVSFNIKPEYPVIVAAKRGDVNITQILLSRGFDPIFEPPAPSPQGGPIHWASQIGHLALVKMLVEKYDVGVDYKDREGKTPLLLAINSGHLKVVEYLLSVGASPTGCGGWGHVAPLEMAIFHNRTEITKCLISQNADINGVIDEDLKSVLHYAAEKRDCNEILTLFLEAGAFVDPSDGFGATPFMNAARQDFVTNMKILYKYGADPEESNDIGLSALDFAVEYNSYEAARYLVVDLSVTSNKLNSLEDILDVYGFDSSGIPLFNLLIRSNVCRRYNVNENCGRYLRSNDPQLRKFLQDVKNYFINPRQLQEICCYKVRHQLGRNASDKVERLPVSNLMKSFLKLSHLS